MQKQNTTLAARIPDPSVPRARLVLRLFAGTSGGTVLHEQEAYIVRGRPVNTASWAWQQLTVGKLATVDCWAEVYVENLSGVPVWFDDLEIAAGGQPVAVVVQEVHYDPWGLELAGVGYNAGGNPEHDFKFQGKELVGDFGLGWYDFQWRQYDPVLGRFNSVDPMAHKREWLTTFNFVQCNPILRVDPDGKTDYILNKETGQVTRHGNENNQSDRILKTDKNGNVRRRGDGLFGFLVGKSRKSDPKVAVNDIARGILRNGMNLRDQNQIIQVGGQWQPTEANVEAFAVKLSGYVGKEIGGAYFSTGNGQATTHMTIGLYRDNTLTRTRGSGHVLGLAAGLTLRALFHTHPSLGYKESDRMRASGTDKVSRDAALALQPNLRFYILTEAANPSDQPIKIDYTHE